MDHDVVIVGAGPRGTYGFRRLALQLNQTPPQRPVRIHAVEASGAFGGGGVHSVSQPEYLLLNTIGSQITAFGDDDAEARTSSARKTLHGYLEARGVSIGPDDYPSRAQHGRYLAEMYDWTEAHLPAGVSLHRYPVAAVDIVAGGDRPLTVRLQDGRGIRADEVLLLTGHARNRIPPDSPAREWADFAERQQRSGRNTSYVHQVYPITETTRHIGPGEGVYVVGMGLTAVDVAKTFSWGRGGRFESGRYLPSGREPRVVLGSRLGLPYAARGRNQKKGLYSGRILTVEAVRRLQRSGGKIDFFRDLMPLVVREMECVYYGCLVGEAFAERLLACETEPERCRLVEERCGEGKRFCWEDLENPFRRFEADGADGRPWFDSLAAYHDFVLRSLQEDITEAEKGNMTSPIKTAVDAVMRDLRDTLRLAVDRGGLTAASHRRFERVFSRVNNRIAVGPPVSSTRELLAMAEAGLLSFSGPRPRLSTDEKTGEFVVESPLVSGSRRRVRHVLNGRIHSVDCRNDSSPLMQNLLKKGMARLYCNADETGRYEPGGLDVTDDFHVVDAQGSAHPHLCALGIPLEGKFWFNAADARPDVDSNAIGQLHRWSAGAVERLRRRESGNGP